MLRSSWIFILSVILCGRAKVYHFPGLHRGRYPDLAHLIVSHPVLSVRVDILVLLDSPVTHLAAAFCKICAFFTYVSLMLLPTEILDRTCRLINQSTSNHVPTAEWNWPLPRCLSWPSCLLILGKSALSPDSRWSCQDMFPLRFAPKYSGCILSHCISLCSLQWMLVLSDLEGVPAFFPFFAGSYTPWVKFSED